MKKLAIVLTILAIIFLGWTIFLKKDPSTMDLEAVRIRLQDAVESGKLTQEQADRKLEWLQKNDSKEELSEGQTRIQDAVNHYWERYADKHPSARIPAKERSKPANLKTMRAQIQSALESGEITQEQAEAKLEWLQQAKSRKGK